VRPDIYIQALY